MFNLENYEFYKKKAQCDLDSRAKKPFDLMIEYKKSISDENYELSKALTEVLKPLNYFTSDTHAHINELNNRNNE